jgi:hypothetical protein
MALTYVKTNVDYKKVDVSTLKMYPRNPLSKLSVGNYKGVSTGKCDIAQFTKDGVTYDMLFVYIKLDEVGTIKVPHEAPIPTGYPVSFAVAVNKDGYNAVKDLIAKKPKAKKIEVEEEIEEEFED